MKRIVRLICSVLMVGLLGAAVACGPDANVCTANKDCQAGFVCVANATGQRTCSPQAPGLVCKQDTDCQKTELCLNGRCQQVPGCVCKQNSDCPSGQKCVGCKCFAGSTGPCQIDDDCGATAQCISGKCIARPSCQNDAQCNLDEVCRQGVCQPSPVCRVDGDCQDGQECVRGRCSRKSLIGCRSDLDCNKPTPICNAATGQCVGCRTDGDCQPGTICQQGTCAPRPCGCQSDADCPDNARCRECQCVNDTPGGGAGSPCKQATDCKPSHLCLQTSGGNSYCFQDCTSSPRSCASNTDGRTTCLEISRDAQGNPISLCLKILKSGEKCGDAGATQAICDIDQQLSCRPDTQTCTPQGSVVRKKAGESCDGQSVICDRSLNLFCDTQSRTCKVASRTAKEGELCDPQGQQGGAVPCESGFTCIQFDRNGNNRCIKLCDPNQAGSCAHNKSLQCLPLLSNGQGICLNYCKTAQDCVFPGYQCRALQAGTQICFPPSPSGPIGFGGICSTPVNTKGCNTDSSNGGDPDFFCLVAQEGRPGYCTRICTADDRCPDYTNSAGTKISSSCIPLDQNGTKACIFFCGQPGQVCPDGLTCQNVGGQQQICLAP